MQSGLLNSNKKCVTNTGEIENTFTPLQTFVEDKINNKKTYLIYLDFNYHQDN